MSLPPLVCNTPPPPDQCEDDKDPEDFDLNYNLSQDDDEDSNSYDYQTYSNYNIYETAKPVNIQDSAWSMNIANNLNSVLTDQVSSVDDNNKTDHTTPIINELSEKLTLEDIAVEDLNLEINQEQLNLQVISSEKSDIDGNDYNYSSEEKVTDEKTISNCDVVETDNVITQSDTVCTTETSENSLPDDVEHLETISKTYELPDDEFNDFHSNLDAKNNETEFQKELESELNVQNEIDNLEEKVQDDDFGDFDEFKYANNDNVSTVVENFDNPWTNEAPTDDFGDFKANFEDDNVLQEDTGTSDVANVDKDICVTNEISDDGDDFGDFDDFKSCTKSAVKDELDDQLNQHIPVIDFHSSENENQVLESINSIFSTIFEEEILEPESEFIGRLESVLNETWGHLVDTDVRQPYMVNWNNSLGQKSLLKALCIDSRNILFGPKWNYNMPKYAVNLSTAPLQPQKQSSTLSNMESQNSDKSLNKENDTWVDPFSSNGQESCNNTENDVAATETNTTDLEVFEKVMTVKLDKVYPTSLNVQPLRQISLPDTHIFTPSDSETPRSKTIHYDTIAPVLLSQTVTEVSTPSTAIPSEVPKLEGDDYWEFQDFKSTTENIQPSKDLSKTDKESDKSNVGSNNLIQSGSSYQPQLLQPIKLEPMVPALNWPDPGEVKETFDDFTDFVSSAPWESDKNTPIIQEDKSEDKATVSNKQNDTTFIETNSNIEGNDDDFETFQSAPTVTQSIHSKPFEDTSSEITYQASSSKSTNFDNAFSDFGKINKNEITKQHGVFAKNVPHSSTENYSNSMSSVRDGFASNSPIHSVETPNMLQPVQASTSSASRHNNTAQILQPLSLESYSQINWPNPGIDLQDLSRFNPVETVPSLKSDISSNSQSKVNSPAHTDKNSSRNEVLDDDIWGEFVSSKPKQQTSVKKPPIFGDEEEWTDFVSSTSIKPQNGLNTISLNVHTNLSLQKSSNLNKLNVKNNQISLDIPTLNYITPKSSRKTYNDKHFQNL
ncbi:PREDICTED: uncharacterized protein LOC106120209 isoform X2 [Papilio xuthus]|uniref:Uncharacterized protein LOC106120209 isoform X2 n=1 Tax=Papilio xuthus TaxID=66420 RepID=A0AAJ7EBS0_PAPXU|nr:PREDICTED: uncharacterized protein LOC106120209 isoform X2 [Papilio xuthus]